MPMPRTTRSPGSTGRAATRRSRRMPRRSSALRKAEPVLAATAFPRPVRSPKAEPPDVAWLSEIGRPLAEGDWSDPGRRRLSMVLRRRGDRRLAVMVNGDRRAMRVLAAGARRLCLALPGRGQPGCPGGGAGSGVPPRRADRGLRDRAARPPAARRQTIDSRMQLMSESELVARRGHLPDLSALLPGHAPATAAAISTASPRGWRMSPRSASTRSGCRRSSSRRWPTWATTSPTIAPSIRCSARSRISTRWSPRRTGSA